MENENNTPSQLDELQAKYDILKRKFDTQQIVNHDLLQQVAQHKMEKIRRKLMGNILSFVAIFIFSIVWIVFVKKLSPAFCAFYTLSMLFVLSRWYVMYRQVLRRTTSTDDLLAAARHYKVTFNISKTYRMIAIPLATVMLVWFILEYSNISLSELSWSKIDRPIVFGLLCGFIAAFISGRKQKAKDTGVCDEIIGALEREE